MFHGLADAWNYRRGIWRRRRTLFLRRQRRRKNAPEQAPGRCGDEKAL